MAKKSKIPKKEQKIKIKLRKRNPSANSLYNQDRYKKVRQENPNLTNNQVFTIISKEWLYLSKQEKQVYYQKSREYALQNPLPQIQGQKFYVSRVAQKLLQKADGEQCPNLDDIQKILKKQQQNYRYSRLRNCTRPLLPFMRYQIQNGNLAKLQYPDVLSQELVQMILRDWNKTHQLQRNEFIKAFQEEKVIYDELLIEFKEIKQALPKKPPTPYLRFFKENRSTYSEKYQDLNSYEITDRMGKDWLKLDQSSQEQYTKNFKQEQQQYYSYKKPEGELGEKIDQYHERLDAYEGLVRKNLDIYEQNSQSNCEKIEKNLLKKEKKSKKLNFQCSESMKLRDRNLSLNFNTNDDADYPEQSKQVDKKQQSAPQESLDQLAKTNVSGNRCKSKISCRSQEHEEDSEFEEDKIDSQLEEQGDYLQRSSSFSQESAQSNSIYTLGKCGLNKHSIFKKIKTNTSKESIEPSTSFGFDAEQKVCSWRAQQMEENFLNRFVNHPLDAEDENRTIIPVWTSNSTLVSDRQSYFEFLQHFQAQYDDYQDQDIKQEELELDEQKAVDYSNQTKLKYHFHFK